MLRNKIRYVRNFCTNANPSFYATTPIFYVNAAPHIGHLYSAVIADAITRYHCLRNPNVEVKLCTGTDEHGTKIQQAAASHGAAGVQLYCDDISARYRRVFAEANVAHTDFIRTTERRHRAAVQHFWRLLQQRGHIYSAQYSGWYCVSDETFLTESQLRLDTATNVRYSLESGHPVEWTQETNYLFRLSALRNDVLNWVREGGRIRPKKFEKILLDMLLDETLPDVSVSRPISRVHWAIPVPGDETQSVYVWLDALINYLTSVGYPDEKFRTHWPPQVQIIGKDILKFHGIYWPAFLIAAGLEPPQQLFVHSHWTVDGQKMSKSKQNVVDPAAMAKVYTMEGLRYFLLREGVAHSDGNYSSVKALRILNAELADTLGNLLSRVCARSLNPRQIYPLVNAAHRDDLLRMDAAQRLQDSLQQLQGRCAQHYDERSFHLVADTVMSTLHAANNFFETARPWELKSNKSATAAARSAESGSSPGRRIDVNSVQAYDDADDAKNAMRLETIIAMAMDALRLCGIVLQPIVPQLSGRLLDKLSVPHERRLWRSLNESFAHATDTAANVDAAAVRPQPLDDINSDRGTEAVLFRRIILKDDDTTDEVNGDGGVRKAAHRKREAKQKPAVKVKKLAAK